MDFDTCFQNRNFPTKLSLYCGKYQLYICMHKVKPKYIVLHLHCSGNVIHYNITFPQEHRTTITHNRYRRELWLCDKEGTNEHWKQCICLHSDCIQIYGCHSQLSGCGVLPWVLCPTKMPKILLPSCYFLSTTEVFDIHMEWSEELLYNKRGSKKKNAVIKGQLVTFSIYSICTVSI